MLIKTAEATNLQIDWMVAKCENKNGILHDDNSTRCIVIAAPSDVYKGRYSPSINWAISGPIIEREEIGIKRRMPCMRGEEWEAMGSTGAKGAGYRHAIGPTPLVAAMRCLVASKLGEVVEVPDNLCASPSHDKKGGNSNVY